MTEPLIVVEGTLRLPPTRPLADPFLRYGREWHPAHSRPVQSHSEVALFGAHMHTAYQVAITLSGEGSTYRAASIWAVFQDTSPSTSLPPQAKALTSSDTSPPPPPKPLPTGDVPPPKPEPVVQSKAYALHSPEPVLLTVITPAPAVVVESAPKPQPAPRMPLIAKLAIIALALAALLSWLYVAQEQLCNGGWPLPVQLELIKPSVTTVCQAVRPFLK
jgi:hypothetical protein